jgi:hypothetical protein
VLVAVGRPAVVPAHAMAGSGAIRKCRPAACAGLSRQITRHRFFGDQHLIAINPEKILKTIT